MTSNLHRWIVAAVIAAAIAALGHLTALYEPTYVSALAATTSTATFSAAITSDPDELSNGIYELPGGTDSGRNVGVHAISSAIKWPDTPPTRDPRPTLQNSPPADVSEETVTGTTHTITGLTGVEYTLRVIATNDVGDGQPSEEATGTPLDATAPEIVTIAVDGPTLTLPYNEIPNGESEPAADTFSVTVNGNARGVNGVAVAGSAVTLTLASAVASRDTVTVSYTSPADAAASRIQDLSSNAAPSFSGRTATNNTATPPPPPPPPPLPPPPPPPPPPVPQAELDPNPADVVFVDTWELFAVTGSNLENVEIRLNTAGSVGALIYSLADPRPAVADTCPEDEETTELTFTVALGQEFGLAGCQEGAVTIELRNQTDGSVLEEYQAAVDAIVEMMPATGLGTPDMVSASYSEETGMVEVSWTRAANASGYIIIAINVNDISGDVVAVPLNDGDLEVGSIGGLSPGSTYDVYVAATGSGGRFRLSEAARVAANSNSAVRSMYAPGMITIGTNGAIIQKPTLTQTL